MVSTHLPIPNLSTVFSFLSKGTEASPFPPCFPTKSDFLSIDLIVITRKDRLSYTKVKKRVSSAGKVKEMLNTSDRDSLKINLVRKENPLIHVASLLVSCCLSQDILGGCMTTGEECETTAFSSP